MTVIKEDYSEKVQYDDPDYPVYIRRSFLSTYPHYAAPSHWHEDIELIAVLSGQMKYSVNGEIIDLKEGEGIFVNSRQMHFGFSDTNEECEFLCILFHPMLLCMTTAYERDFVLPVIRHTGLSFLHLCPETGWQKEIWRQIRSVYLCREKPAARMRMGAAFLTIWSLIYENMSLHEKQQQKQDTDLVTVKNMIGFIQQNYAGRVSLSEIAASGMVGQSKCCKLFTKYLGETPNMYLTRYRLNKSMILLRNTDKTITEIAMETGFGSGSYYAETFRKWMGKSPREFRAG